MDGINTTELAVFAVLFLAVSLLTVVVIAARAVHTLG